MIVTYQDNTALPTENQAATPLSQISTGAGVAIAGIWVAASALTAFLFWGIWLNQSWSDVKSENTSFWSLVGILFLVWLTAAPVITAAKLTRLIIKGKEE